MGLERGAEFEAGGEVIWDLCAWDTSEKFLEYVASGVLIIC